MLRFAPSPTGDMHIGDLRVALFNYIIARQRNEDFIVRIEDTIKEQNIEGKDQEILDLLALFGIEYTQVIYQSQNVRFHAAMALQLLHEKKAFSCFCSSAWIDNKKQEALNINKDYSYDDACRNLPAELVIDNTNPFTVRIIRPDEDIVIQDKIQGEMSFTPDAVDSFIIMNQDKTPTYNFASGVDDMLSDISLIIRDDKYRTNTPKQEHVRRSLAYDKTIEYAHVQTLSKADSVNVKSLLEEGYLPEAILNYLVSIGNDTPKEIFTMSEEIEFFTLEKISKDPIEFNVKTLQYINKEHLKNLDPKELSRYVGFADEEIGNLAYLYLEEVSTTKELKAKIAPIFAQRIIPKELSEQVRTVAECIKQAPYFDEFSALQNYITEKTDLEEKSLSQALRLLLTNAQNGPELSKIYKYLKNYLGEIVK
jgi:glutamyl-tRNA synthetase